MSDKTIHSKKNPAKKPTQEIILLIEKKILFFQDVIQTTILHVQKSKNLDIICTSELNGCINLLIELSKKINGIVFIFAFIIFIMSNSFFALFFISFNVFSISKLV